MVDDLLAHAGQRLDHAVSQLRVFVVDEPRELLDRLDAAEPGEIRQDPFAHEWIGLGLERLDEQIRQTGARRPSNGVQAGSRIPAAQRLRGLGDGSLLSEGDGIGF